MTLNDFVGVPYLDRGRGRDGADCWGLIVIVYRELLDIELPSYSDHYKMISERDARDIAQVITAERSDWQRLWLADEPDVYDLVLLNIGGVPCHIGVYAGHRTMLHVQRGMTSWIESLDRPRWQPRIEGYYRYAPG
jgi:cell wall-associated NlpC family hydrolase